jgi:hypothetical protein
MKESCFWRVTASCGLLTVLAGGMVPHQGLAQVQDPFVDVTLGPPVRIVSPANHAVFYAPVDIPIFAYTRSEVRFTNVEFYANGTDLGHGVNLSSTNRIYPTLSPPTLMGPAILERLGALWGLVWSNAPAGTYKLTAVASGLELFQPEGRVVGLNVTSAPVNITILSSTNGTNPMDVVDIVATDPIAIAGTNMSWVWPGMTNAIPSWTNWPPPHWGYYTNWGPKPALFTVRRFGDTSSDLTLNYQIGGTASNGVDYAELPGIVSIPSGASHALIPIVPIDNSSNNVAKSVILTLAASTNMPPDYDVGFPPCAEVIILYHWPRPLPWVLPDGGFHFNANGPDGAWFTVQSSSDLMNWISISTNQVIEGSVDFVDPNALGGQAGFYRVVPLNSSPSP